VLTRAQIPPPTQVYGIQTDEGQLMCAAECMGVNDIDASTRCYPSRRSSAEFALRNKHPVFLINDLVQQGEPLFEDYMVVMHPIFIDTTNASYNATFGRGYEVHDCPIDSCYDAETGMRFWGMVHLTARPPDTR
jgi:hypothetical protein